MNMFKILSISFACLMIASSIDAVQIIYEGRGNYQKNLQEEQQQLLREQVETQKKMLQVQQQQYTYQRYGW